MFSSFGFVSKRQKRQKEKENPNPQITFESNRFVLNQAAMEALGNPEHITFACNEGIALNEPETIYAFYIVNADSMEDVWRAKLPKNGSFRNKKVFSTIKDRGFNPSGTFDLTLIQENPNVVGCSPYDLKTSEADNVQQSQTIDESQQLLTASDFETFE